MNKLPLFHLFLNSYDFDIVFVTETWLKKTTPNSIICPNPSYQIFRSDRPNKKGGGALIAISCSYIAIQIPTPASSKFDLVVLDISDFQLLYKIRLICAYRPPNLTTGDNEIFIDTLSEFILTDSPIIICGDFNYTSFDSSIARPFFEFCESASLKQLVEAYTRENHILDLVISNFPSLITDINIQPPFSNSDHNMVTFNLQKSTSKPQVRESLNFNKADYSLINCYFFSINWSYILAQCPDIESKYLSFLSHIHFAIDFFVPKSTIGRKPTKLPCHIKNLLKFRSEIWPHINDPATKIKFICATRKLGKELKKFQRYKEKKILSKNPDKIFSHVSNFLKPKSSGISVLKIENQVVSKPQEQVELLSDYFSSVFTRDKFPISNFQFNSDKKLSYVHFFPDEILKFVKDLPNKCSASPDNIPNIFLKNCIFSLLPALSHIFQYSCYSGTLPSYWRNAIVIPLLKEPPHDIVTNYRPISLTSSLCKILERKIYNELYSHFTTLGILPNYQHGFRSKKSTTTQLLETLDEWTHAIESGFCIDVVYFDFSKAFDTIPHDRLLLKLKAVGITSALLTWIENFLNRTFSVKSNNCLSDEKIVTSGVPQGSVLGPLLFIFYISDLLEHCRCDFVKIKLFADDLKSYAIHTNELLTLSSLQNFIDKLSLYSTNNGLKLNVKKCHTLQLGRKNHGFKYTLDGDLLESQNSVRDLGIYLTKDLKWSLHLKTITNKANTRLFLLFKSIQSCDSKFLVKMYYAYIRPLLDYGSPIFNSSSKQNCLLIEKVQKRFTRFVFSRCYKYVYNPMPPYLERLKILGMESLESRRLKTDLFFFQKLLTNEIHIESSLPIFCDIFTTRTNPRGIYPIIGSKNIRSEFFLVRTAKLYLKLPLYIVNLPVSSFINAVKNLDILSLI